MGKNSDYFRLTVMGLALIGLLVGGAHIYAYWKKTKEVIYDNDFNGVVMVARVNGKIITSACTKIQANLKISDTEVIVTLNGDTLRGVPVDLTDKGGLVVKFSESFSIIIYKADPDGDGVETLIVEGPAETIILSTSPDCEDIAALLGQEAER